MKEELNLSEKFEDRVIVWFDIGNVSELLKRKRYINSFHIQLKE